MRTLDRRRWRHAWRHRATRAGSSLQRPRAARSTVQGTEHPLGGEAEGVHEVKPPAVRRGLAQPAMELERYRCMQRCKDGRWTRGQGVVAAPRAAAAAWTLAVSHGCNPLSEWPQGLHDQ